MGTIGRQTVRLSLVLEIIFVLFLFQTSLCRCQNERPLSRINRLLHLDSSQIEQRSATFRWVKRDENRPNTPETEPIETRPEESFDDDPNPNSSRVPSPDLDPQSEDVTSEENPTDQSDPVEQSSGEGQGQTNPPLETSDGGASEIEHTPQVGSTLASPAPHPSQPEPVYHPEPPTTSTHLESAPGAKEREQVVQNPAREQRLSTGPVSRVVDQSSSTQVFSEVQMDPNGRESEVNREPVGSDANPARADERIADVQQTGEQGQGESEKQSDTSREPIVASNSQHGSSSVSTENSTTNVDKVQNFPPTTAKVNGTSDTQVPDRLPTAPESVATNNPGPNSNVDTKDRQLNRNDEAHNMPTEVQRSGPSDIPKNDSMPTGTAIVPMVLLDKKNESINNGLVEEYRDLWIDKESCNKVPIPGAILNMTIERIFKLLGENNCSRIMDLKLKPAINKRIQGHIMEASSMPFDLASLISSGTLKTSVKCKIPEPTRAKGNEEKSMVHFELSLLVDLADDLLKSRWRHHPKLQVDDIPLQMPFGLSTVGHRSASSSLTSKRQGGTKCQKFKMQSGDFYLDLLSFRLTLNLSVMMIKLDEHTYAIQSDHGGHLELKKLKVNKLYLDHRMDLSQALKKNSDSVEESNAHAISSATKLGRLLEGHTLPTVQILHDHNNHHRRNNWLLDVYGNWLGHEYRSQLNYLFQSSELLARLNACLTT